MRQIIVHCEPETIHIALTEEGRLVEYASERRREQSMIGSFYKGRVVNVLPGMQAAFVDIGLKKNAFLYVDEVLHPHLEKQPKEKPSIADLLSVGQQLIVQVMKEPRGGKGARVTTHFSLPGRCMVFMPNAGYVAVSKKIQRESERSRLKWIGEQIRSEEEGIIMRTVSEDETVEALTADLEQLRMEWARIRSRAGGCRAPALLHKDLGIISRFIRDVYNPHQDDIIIDREMDACEAENYLKDMVPGISPRVRIHEGDTSIFKIYGIEEQLKSAFGRKITLPGGGTVIIDQTEALTVIDVNSAKYVGADNFEETVTCINLLAAREIAKVIRLRDIGGMIIIDFIDMEEEQHRQEVVAAMEEVISRDRTKSFIVGWTKLGLLELTRKKGREGSLSPFAKTCPVCGGAGTV